MIYSLCVCKLKLAKCDLGASAVCVFWRLWPHVSCWLSINRSQWWAACPRMCTAGKLCHTQTSPSATLSLAVNGRSSRCRWHGVKVRPGWIQPIRHMAHGLVDKWDGGWKTEFGVLVLVCPQNRSRTWRTWPAGCYISLSEGPLSELLLYKFNIWLILI